jgi:hypothetical protein
MFLNFLTMSVISQLDPVTPRSTDLFAPEHQPFHIAILELLEKVTHVLTGTQLFPALER